MTRATLLCKWALLVSVVFLGVIVGPVSGTISVIVIAVMAWVDRAEIVEHFTTAGQFMDFYRREQATSAFDSEENFVHVEFDPARDDLREITEDAREEGFEEFDRATMGDGTQVLIFRRTVSR